MHTLSHNHTIALALIGMIAAATACSDNDNSTTGQPTSPTTPVADYDSTYSPAYNLYIIDDDTMTYETEAYNGPLTDTDHAIAHQLDDYATDMLTEYDSQGYDNTVVSPVSASMLYGLMGNFVEQEADNAFLDAMGMEQASTEQVNTYFRKFINKKGTNQEESKNSGKSRLRYSSNLWMNRDAAVYKSFLSKSRFYGFGVKGMNLSQPDAIASINNSIGSLIGSQGMAIPNSVVQAKASTVITSTMDFEGKWLKPMRRDSIGDNTFTNADGTRTNASIIAATYYCGRVRFASFDIMELPYRDSSYAMYVVLPHNAQGLAKSLTELKQRGMTHVMDAAATDSTGNHHAVIFTPRDTTYYVYNDSWLAEEQREKATITVTDTLVSDTVFDVRLPKFDITTTTSLSTTGAKADKATKRMYQTNLPKVAPSGFHLSNVFQTCRISIDEYGTTAQSRDSLAVVDPTIRTGGANTGTQGAIIKPIDGDEKALNPVPHGRKTHETVRANFHANHPFAIFVRDKEMGTIPFASTVRNMSSATE